MNSGRLLALKRNRQLRTRHFRSRVGVGNAKVGVASKFCARFARFLFIRTPLSKILHPPLTWSGYLCKLSGQGVLSMTTQLLHHTATTPYFSMTTHLLQLLCHTSLWLHSYYSYYTILPQLLRHTSLWLHSYYSNTIFLYDYTATTATTPYFSMTTQLLHHTSLWLHSYYAIILYIIVRLWLLGFYAII